MYKVVNLNKYEARYKGEKAISFRGFAIVNTETETFLSLDGKKPYQPAGGRKTLLDMVNNLIPSGWNDFTLVNLHNKLEVVKVK